MSKTSLKEIRISQNNALIGTNATGDVEEKLINTLKNDLELEADDVDDSTSTNKFVQQSDKDKLSNIEPGAQVNPTNTEIVSAIDTELGQTDWQTGGTGGSDTAAQVKTKYESNADTNAFTDADESKLDGIESGAEVNRTGSETVSLIDTELGSTTWQLGGSGGGSSNPNEFVPSTASDLSNPGNAGQIACLQTNITLTADLTLANGLILKNCGGSLNISTFTLTGQNNSIYFNGDETVVNSFSGTIDGTWKQPRILATTLGAIDDNLTTTDNFNVGKNLLHLVNQSSGELIWNKKDTGVYYRRATDYDLGSPFFPNLPVRDTIWVIGDGFDDVKITHQGSTKIKVIPNNTSDSAIYLTYNTKNPVIQGGTLEGDRYEHFYDQGLQVLTPASTAGNVRLRILEFNPKLDNDIVNEINEVFPLSNGGTQANIDEIVAFVNTDAAFSDYTLTDSGNGLDMRISGQPGVFYNIFLTDESTGGTFNDPVSPYEWGHCIVIGSNTINVSVRDIDIIKFHGDGIARQTQGNGTAYTNFADLTQGNIDEFGVTDTDPDFYYQTVQRLFDTRHKWFRLQGRSGQSIDLAFWRYWIAYYDINGNFVEKSPELTPYQYYLKPTEEYAQYKIIVDNNGSDITGFDYNIATESYAFGGEFKNITFDENRRHCITNPPLGVIMENIKFYNTGGVLPEGGVNIEDYGKKAIGYTFLNCEFQNNVGFDIILQGPSQVNITGCRFLSNSYNVQGQYNAPASSISTGFGRQVNINNCFFDNKAIGVDLYASFVNNKVNKGSLNIRSANVFVNGNTFVNTRIDGEDFSNGSGGLDVSYFRNNLLLYSEPWGNYSILEDENILVWENNTIKFNDQTTQHLTLTDANIRDFKLNNTGNSYLRAQSTTTDDPEHRGRIKGLRVEGLQVIDSGLHNLGFPYYASDIEDLNVSTSLMIDHGYFKDFGITNSKINGWLYLILDQFPDDGVGDFKTITIKNTDFILPANIDANEGYLNNSQYGGTQVTKFLRVAADKNVNLVFENVNFISNDTTNDRFMYLGHRGTTKFLSCTFSAPNTEVIDLTSTGASAITGGVYAGVNTGAVTIINPTYNNISFNLRVGDTEVFYGGNATDVDAIHDNVAGEINAITEKAIPVSNDIVIIEDSEDSFNKKKANLSTLLGGGSGFTLANGEGTTANGSSVDLGGSINTEVSIDIIGTALEEESLSINGSNTSLNTLANLTVNGGSVQTLVEDDTTGDGTSFNSLTTNINLGNNNANSSELIQAGQSLITLQSSSNSNADVQALTITPTTILFPNLTNTIIDASAGTTPITRDYFTANLSGFDGTTDKLMSDGTNTSPIFDQENSANTRLRTYVQGSISYIESDDLSTETARDLRIKALAIKPTTSGTMDFGSNGLKMRDFYGRNMLAAEFRKDGGTSSEFLKADGSSDSNSYLEAPESNLVNISRDLNLADNRNIVKSSGSAVTYTVRLESAINFPIGSTITIVNESINTITIAAEAGVTINENVGGLTLTTLGDKRTLIKTGTDTWVLGY